MTNGDVSDTLDGYLFKGFENWHFEISILRSSFIILHSLRFLLHN